MVPGRSKKVFKAWLDGQTAEFRDGVEVVAMDGFSGFKTATAEDLPEATAVMDPFHVVALAGDEWSISAANASSRPPSAIVAGPGTRSTGSAACCTPALTCSPTSRSPA